MTRSIRLRAFAIASLMPAVAFAGGCGHMPVSSMLTLARVDFAATDPAELRAAIKLPRLIRPQPQGVSLRIAVKLASGEEEVRDFTLREIADAQDARARAPEPDADTHVFAYRLEAMEVTRLVAFRDALKSKQAASGGRGGTLTISIRPQGCRSGELPRGPILFTTYLRSAETGGYVALTRDVDLRTIDPKQDLAATMPPCGLTAPRVAP
jgi:hypothetical protein